MIPAPQENKRKPLQPKSGNLGEGAPRVRPGAELVEVPETLSEADLDARQANISSGRRKGGPELKAILDEEDREAEAPEVPPTECREE